MDTQLPEHNLVATLGAHYRGYNGKGFGGPSPEAWFTRLHTLRLCMNRFTARNQDQSTGYGSRERYPM